jgi:acetyl esterase/lipase
VVPERVLSARALRLLDQAKVRCVDGLEFDTYMAGMRWANSVEPEGWDAIAKNQVGLNAPSAGYRAPVFLGSGSTDIDVPLPAQTALAEKMCRAGASVQHHVYECLDHSCAVNASLKDSGPFVRQLMAGQAPVNTCKPVTE